MKKRINIESLDKTKSSGVKVAMLKTIGLDNLPSDINELLIALISYMINEGNTALEIHRILTLRLFRAATLIKPNLAITLSHDIKAKKYYIQAKTRWLMDDYTWKDYRVHIGSPEAFGMAGLSLAQVKNRIKNDKPLREQITKIATEKMTLMLKRRIMVGSE